MSDMLMISVYLKSYTAFSILVVELIPSLALIGLGIFIMRVRVENGHSYT
jgi:hypothetical protein